jgi:hypothetical protein
MDEVRKKFGDAAVIRGIAFGGKEKAEERQAHFSAGRVTPVKMK